VSRPGVLADATGPFEVAGALPEGSLALEASAGTGKTWTLTALAVRYVAEGGVTLPELLLVTFTRAATAELRERVRTRLAETLEEAERALADPERWKPADPVLDRVIGDALRLGDAELVRRRDRLRAAAQQLDEATISTIHGFCQRMLHHAALEAGVDFDAVLLEDDGDLLAEIVDDHLARELRPADPAWVRYLQDCAKVDRARLTVLARSVSSLPALQLRPALADTEGPYGRPWEDAVSRFATLWEHGGRARAVELIGRLHAEGTFTSGQRTFTGREAEKKAGLVDAWLAPPPPVPSGPVKRADVHKLSEYPMGYFTANALATQLAEGRSIPDDELLRASAGVLDAAMAPATLFLHRAATYLWHELDRRKRQRTVLTFDDLLRRLAGALESDATRATVRQAIRQRYRVALIDEFQDTDPIQWRIFSALFDLDEPFVLIGDPKQAIYGFRGADIHTYVDARDTRPERRTLQTNHRSDRGYVAACNQLFGQPGAFATDDIPYHDIEAHHPDRLRDPAGGAALQFRYVPREAGTLDQRGSGLGVLTKGWADRALPGDLAAVAVALLDAGIVLDGEPDGTSRELAPRDLAVLVQTNRRASAVQRALVAAGVPAVIQRGGSVFATDEAEALQRLLAALLRPSSERAAVAAAASVLFGRDAATLVAQRDVLDRRSGQEPSAAEDAAARTDEVSERSTGTAWDDWLDALTRWGERWQQAGVLPAVQLAFAEDGVPPRLLATPQGDRRLTNVRHLVELLHAAEVSSRLTPNALLDWLHVRRADAADGDQPTVETELRLEEDAEAVRVVTVHGSKGLQYPVVLCPDLWDGRTPMDERFVRFHDPDLADPRAAITLDLDADTGGERKQRSVALARDEARREKLRLAYVALTRAQHRCIVWWGPFKDASISPLASLLHGGDEGPGERSARGEARLSAADPELLADLRRFAERSGGAVEVQEVTELGRDASWTPPPREEVVLTARSFTRGDVDRTWRRTSFSALVRNAGPHGHRGGLPPDEPEDGRDVDAGSEDGAAAGDPAPGTTTTSDEPEVPLARFPRGAGPGTFLHDVLERLDLTALDDDRTVDEVLAAMEVRHGIGPAHRSAVRQGLRAAVASPFGPVAQGVRLADLSPSARANELRFELPLAGGHRADRPTVTLAAVAELLREADDPLLVAYADRLLDPALRGRVRGFLNGSIDLLARLPDGRFLVADYKSNWFGDRATGRSVARDYGPDDLATAMLDSHYVLQALLYLVAAHRYLRWRVRDYDYDTHLAGAAYLFLRGMVGPETPLIDGHPCGVASLRPSGALVGALSRLLDGGGR
jgi:exodeoxyribonuclease V beta subunit